MILKLDFFFFFFSVIGVLRLELNYQIKDNFSFCLSFALLSLKVF